MCLTPHLYRLVGISAKSSLCCGYGAHAGAGDRGRHREGLGPGVLHRASNKHGLNEQVVANPIGWLVRFLPRCPSRAYGRHPRARHHQCPHILQDPCRHAYQGLAIVSSVFSRPHDNATRWRKLTAGWQTLLVVAYLCQGETFAYLAWGVEVGTSTVDHSTLTLLVGWTGLSNRPKVGSFAYSRSHHAVPALT